VSPATIRPTLAAGGAGPPQDPTITVIRGDEVAAPGKDDALGQLLAGTPSDDEDDEDDEDEPPPPAEPSIVDRLAIRVTIAIGKRVIVQRTDAHLRLTGELEVTKVAGGEVQVVGAIESENGWYLFQGRRVEIEEAALRFGGEWPIDPALEVSASARSGGYEVDIEINGTLSEPTLNLSSSPPLDQGDILSVLLFGRPASQLSGGQGEILQRQGLSVLANYVAPELQRSLMDTLGLAAVTFSMPTGDRAGTVGVGRYFGNDLFVSLAQDFGGPKGGTQRQLQGLIGTSVTIQYSLTPSVTLQTASSTEGESSVDVIWHRRY
jgi:autotransporter translocation and assembly factor TamB